MTNLKKIALKYFQDHPEAKESVENSPFYQKNYFQSLSKLPKRSPFNTFKNLVGNFKTNYGLFRRKRYSFTRMCQMAKLAIKDYIFPTRFDGAAEYCSWLLNTEGEIKNNVKDILEDEEENFHKSIEKGKKVIDKYWNDISELTGEDLSWLHQTHGVKCYVVEEYFEKKLTDAQFSDYQKVYEIHKSTGLKGYRPKVIKAI